MTVDLKKIIFVILCFFPCFSFSQDIVLTSSDNIISEISKGRYGDRFLLKKGEYTIQGTIFVPSGVSIYGEFGVNLIKAHYYGINFFDISGSENVEISNLDIVLGVSDSAIVATSSTITQNIKISNLRINGVLETIHDNKNTISYTAISIKNGRNIDISSNTIENTTGGIYVYGENIHIINNQLKHVSWGNVVVNGSYIDIIGNLILGSGIGTFSRLSEGDAITVLDKSSNVKVLSNTLETGYCHLIWIHSHCRNVEIKQNYVKNSITTGVYIDSDVHDLVISHNQFIGNIGYGLALLPVFGNVLVEDNLFRGNTLYVDPRNTFLSIINNSFSDILREQSVINEDYSFFSFDDNYIQNISSPPSDPPDLLVIDDSGSIVNDHSDIFFDKKTFFIKNQGQILLKLIGLPFIRLSSEILQETDYLSQLSFSSINGVFIAPLNQPKKVFYLHRMLRCLH